MSYLDSGYNQFFMRKTQNISTYKLDNQSSIMSPEMPGSVIAGGVSRGRDSRFKVDWNNSNISVSDGIRTRVVMGYIVEESKYGIKILDANGDVVFSAAGQVTDDGIEGVVANKILTGEIVVAVDIGNPASGFIRLDGPNARIVINDGTTNRLVLGDV